MARPFLRIALLTVLAVTASGGAVRTEQRAPIGEWRYYGGDPASTKYSPLDQIDASNVATLRIAWRWKSDNFGPRPEYNWEVTPLMAGGVLYFTAGTRRDVVAVDAATGETLWVYRLDEGARGELIARQQNRGVAYWTDGSGDERILVISPGYQLVAVNVKDGRPIERFGTKGLVDLWQGLDRDTVEPGTIGASSPPLVVGDVVVVGAALQNGTAPRSKANTPAYIRGYDVRTGRRLWTFRTIPQAGEFGNETWEAGSWRYTGNTGAWAPLSADPALGYVYIPVEAPTGDYYGGNRPGNNLFANSLVCLDAKTGRRVWHFQFVHHDIWDWDLASPPILLDVTVNGRPVKAVAQVTKQSWVYAFDRVTGEPIWPIEERPVPQSDVPGEKTSPTQPHVTRPAAFDRQGSSIDDLISLTPELNAEARAIARHLRFGPIFTPATVYDEQGIWGTLMLPENQGGANWPGGVADPETGVLYVSSVTNPYVLAVAPADPERSDMGHVGRTVGRIVTDAKGVRVNFGPQGLPIVNPPWGRITAIDMNTGDHVWTKPNGPAPEYVLKHPALEGIDLSNAGRPERAMLLVTKTLLFAGDGSGLFTNAPGGAGNKLRAYDKRTGAVIHERELPAGMTGVPMTYETNGKQYVVFAIGAPGHAAELVALTLP
ncbi:MAG: PQQ-binding-like beta-propeller repeat protein [Acidobacteria bacterium]|nr:PQQ-binding-like beta-propeller repeat protein [Acidobacteriota bacterium]